MLDNSLMNSVRTEAVRQKRSVEEQIAHWVKIGEAVEESPSYNYANIQAVFDGEKTHEELTFEEYQVWFDEVMKKKWIFRLKRKKPILQICAAKVLVQDWIKTVILFWTKV